MVCKIVIGLSEDASNKAKGNCFESMIRNILHSHQYKVRENLRFTGMEIDFIAEHKSRTNEILYVECKAKEKVSSTEIRNFVFNVLHKKARIGYFFRTQELSADAGGLLQEFRDDERYKHLFFFEPDNIIRMLKDGNFVFEDERLLADYIISKKILAVTYFGDFFIYLINEQNAFPTKALIANASYSGGVIRDGEIKKLIEKVPEIKELELIQSVQKLSKVKDKKNDDILFGTISEVQSSNNWYDFLPASPDKKHFVGREEITNEIMLFLKKIRSGVIDKRVFYLNGKSGLGKSSLVLELKNKCENKHYRKKFFSLAVDCRSATSEGFVALAFKRIIDQAINKGFIKVGFKKGEVQFTSKTDLLTSSDVIEILDYLLNENRFLVLVFDQFEDVFRKENFFVTFYKFLTEVSEKRLNIIVGFSWKSEFFVQNDDPSYHVWQQAKEHATLFTITEFSSNEIGGLIKQLEQTVGKLTSSLRNRIVESSQGLPWLTKKLCVHVFKQFEQGVDLIKLSESNLNIALLFKQDEELLNGDELRALHLIANRANEGDYFSEIEVGDMVDPIIIRSLLHEKKLIIKSGANYNIYWDIYRDYLVNGTVPIIGESYIIRQPVALCFEVFSLFSNGQKYNPSELLLMYNRSMGIEALNNIIVELNNLGLIEKDEDLYFIPNKINNSESFFKSYMVEKFKNYRPVLELFKLTKKKITKQDVIDLLKKIFKQEFKENTWGIYASSLIGWVQFSGMDLGSKFHIVERGKKLSIDKISENIIDDYLPRISLTERV